jgi:YgiT-type zinc finger domain-containing protein
MLKVKRKVYTLALCSCGKLLDQRYSDVTTLYNKQHITVRDVPIFICSSGHIKIARQDRLLMKVLLKTAYEKGMYKIKFNR